MVLFEILAWSMPENETLSLHEFLRGSLMNLACIIAALALFLSQSGKIIASSFEELDKILAWIIVYSYSKNLTRSCMKINQHLTSFHLGKCGSLVPRPSPLRAFSIWRSLPFVSLSTGKAWYKLSRAWRRLWRFTVMAEFCISRCLQYVTTKRMQPTRVNTRDHEV